LSERSVKRMTGQVLVPSDQPHPVEVGRKCIRARVRRNLQSVFLRFPGQNGDQRNRMT
jgi:hypothetical protein